MEASALPSRLTRGRAPLSAALLRLRSDEQLVALFRDGSDDAFRVIHDRYRARLLAYARRMLQGAACEAEDALQDVFLRAYRSLRASERPVSLRAWLYRIAHNRCIDELRRARPAPGEPEADAHAAPAATAEPAAVAERSAVLARLLADVQSLPSQQRSAILMRELQGLSYQELAGALSVSVPAVKSLLLRARTGLVDLATARETPCSEIRDELLLASDRRVRVSGRARRHCAECAACEDYRGELRRVRRGFAALVGGGPLGHLGVLAGLGGGGGVVATGGGTFAGITATKLAVAACCAALIGTAGSAVIGPGATHHAAPATQAVPASAPPVRQSTMRLSSPPARASATPRPPPATPAHRTPSAQPPLLAPAAGRGVGGAGASGPPSGGSGGPAPTSEDGTTSEGATGSTGTTGAISDEGASTGPSGPTDGASGINGTGAVQAPTGPTGVSPLPAGATGTAGASGASAPVAPDPTGPTGTSGPAGAGAAAPALR